MTGSSSERVVMTRPAVETCLGGDADSFWKKVCAGESGIRPIDRFDVSDLPCQVAGLVDFDPSTFMTGTEQRRTSVFIQYLHSVVQKATLDTPLPDPHRIGVVVGTGGGGIPHLAGAFAGDPDRYLRGRWSSWDPFLIPKSLSNMAAGYAAMAVGATGPALTITTACAAGTDALGLARRLIRDGDADVVVVGAVDVWVTRELIAAFSRIRALSERPSHEASLASRPFDIGRDGMVPSDGAACVLVETPRTAERAGREIVAELCGAASNCDAYSIVAPREDGSVAGRVITAALAQAGVAPEVVDHVNAHGTSTPLNDVAETRAIRNALGARASQVPVTAPKSMLGHASGASGLIEAIVAAFTLRDQFVPPTINLTAPDPQCDLDYTCVVGRACDLEYAVSCSFGFGGQNSAAVLRRWSDA